MSEWKKGDPERRAEDRETATQTATATAAKVVSDAAAVAIKTIADAASIAQAVLSTDMSYIKKDISEIKLMLESKYITKDQFGPVKAIVFGFSGLVFAGVVGSLLTLVLRQQ